MIVSEEICSADLVELDATTRRCQPAASGVRFLSIAEDEDVNLAANLSTNSYAESS